MMRIKMETRLLPATSALTLALGLMLSLAAPAADLKPQRIADGGMCRRPPMLAALPPEEKTRPRQPRIAHPISAPATAETDAAASTVVMAPPPVPSAAPPAPMMAKSSRGAVKRATVAGSKVAAPASAEVARTRGDRTEAATPRVAIATEAPQSGTLTAGEHDDLLNPQLYADYVRASNLGQSIKDLPKLDTRRVLTVQVQDGAGRPVPFADVMLTCADGNTFSLSSAADGSVVFFPQLDRLGTQVKLDVRRGTQALAAQRMLTLARAGSQRVDVRSAQTADAVTQFDLMVVLDTTGSMGDELEYLNAELQAIVQRIGRQHRGLDIRVALMLYRDKGDEYVTRTFPFTRDLKALQSNIAQQSADGGGDYPEAVQVALHRAVTMDWRPGAVKSLLWVADAPPHDEDVAHAWKAVETARAKRIHIVPVAASGVGESAEYLMRASAALTQSRYIFLTDDSGVGNPHAPPTVDCYLVTRLDRMVQRVLESQISGRRVEPAPGEIIRRVGNYDRGRCLAPRPG